MTEELDLAARFRMRAEEFRTVAAVGPRGSDSATLTHIAAAYDQLAQTAENIARTDEAIRSRVSSWQAAKPKNEKP